MEKFLPIQGYPGYQIGELGTVKSLKHKKERGLRLRIDRYGYLCIMLRNDTAQKNLKVHRLVALHFIPNPENKPTVNHLDGDKRNCKKSNLEWSTQLENNQHAVSIGLSNNKGSNNPSSKLDIEKVRKIRELKGVHSCRELGNMFGVSKATISHIHNGLNW